MTVIQDARAVLNKDLSFEEFYDLGRYALEDLIACAEQWQVQAIKWRAWSMFIEEELDAIPQDKNYGDYYLEYERKAALEIVIEPPAWKHIGPEEQEAIKIAIRFMINSDKDHVRDARDVLSKLLEE